MTPRTFCRFPSRDSVTASFALASAVLGMAATASAQEPDVRNVRPNVMLLVDTSASMQTVIGGRSGSIEGRASNCVVSERDRWTSLIEVLTGDFATYRCRAEGTVARPYTMPLAQRPDGVWDRPDGYSWGQQPNGILDTYGERVRFGLMMYDNVYGLPGVTDISLTQLHVTELTAARRADWLGEPGDYSYGPDRILSFTECLGNPYIVNAGARSVAAGDTGMVSFGVDDPNDAGATAAINTRIQRNLMSMRPFGATPTAALLDDYEYYLNTDPDVARPGTAGALDSYAACRDQYAILITDGQPSDVYRDARIGCDRPGPENQCPYERSHEIVARMCGSIRADGSCSDTRFRGLFAVLFEPGASGSAEVTQARSAMDLIAMAGATGHAYVASDAAGLRGAISAALDRAAPGTRTRTTPSFASSNSGSGGQGQYQITSGFLVGGNVGGVNRPWQGVLNRQRWECDGTTPVQRPINDTDRFANTLTAQTTRNLISAIPRVADEVDGIITGGFATTFPYPAAPTGSTTRVSVPTMQPFAEATAALSIDHFGLTGPTALAERTETIRWVRADSGSGRETAKLGDIYHSTPTVVTAPQNDIADESYNLFRRRLDVSTRPAMVYFGTNDGIIHGIALENYTPTTGTPLTGGQEVWGFIPPAVIPRLDEARLAHQFLADGVPIVRDVFFVRRPGDLPSADQYHTVLLMGLRQGGNAYVALDVTDPLHPVFLWQWTHDAMGQTYGRPALAQALVDSGSGPQERAVAILPGGMGARLTGECTIPTLHRAPQSAGQTTGARSSGACWGGTVGQSFHVVDVASGEAIRTFGPGTGLDQVSSPMVGAVSLFTGQTGSIATRAYTTSADGVVWRLDMTDPNPANWTFRPFHDTYWHEGALAGHPSPEPPIVSVDAENRPVVIIGTGDPENMETPGVNYVTSLTEVTPPAGERVATAILNWEVRLRENEMVTGPLELFDGRVYFGTFFSAVTPGDSCSFGSSKLWGVHFTNTGSTVPGNYTAGPSGRFPAFGWEAAGDAGDRSFTSHFMELGENQIVQGVGITQRPTCVDGSAIADPYMGARFNTRGVGGGSFELVAQVSSTSRVTEGAAPEVATVSRTLPAPVASTRVSSQASQVDF